MLTLGFGLIGCASFLFASVVFIGMIFQQPLLLIPFLLAWFAWPAMKDTSAEPAYGGPPSSG